MLKNMYQKTKNSIKKNQDRLNQEKMSVFSKVGMAIKLFFLYLAHSVLHAFALLFTSPEKCFVMATNQDPKGTWSKSYYQHLLFQRRVRLYSTTSFFTIIIAVITASLAFNVIFPPTEIKFANAAGDTYVVTFTSDTNNNLCVGNLSLREALNCASPGDIVDATGISGTITLANAFGSLEIPSGVTVNLNSTVTINAAAVDPAILISGKSDVTLNDAVVNSASGDSIVVNSSSSQVTINDCIISQSTDNGIVIGDSSSQGVVDGCEISVSGENAILLNNTGQNTITDTAIGGSTLDGIRLTNSSGSNTISNNTINNNTGRGINIQASSTGNTVSGNTVNNNTKSGIRLANSANSNTITENRSSNSGSSGIVVTGSSSNTITENDFFENDLYGVDVVDSSSDNIISDNAIYSNDSGGGHVETGSTGNYFYQNIVTSQTTPYVNEDSLGIVFNTAVASGDTNKLYLDFSDIDVSTDAQVAVGSEGGDALSEYLEDVVLNSQAFQGVITIDDDQISNYNQICVLTMADDQTTYTPACLNLEEDKAVPEVTISNSGTTVTLTATDDVDPAPAIYYTTNGTTPTTSSTLYSESFIVASGTTVKALAVDLVENNSLVVEEIIIIEEEPDTTAPVISKVTAGGITATTATITWTTDEAATSQVLYGLTENNLNKVITNSSLITSHSLGLIGLSADTKYYYKVKSADGSGNLSTSVVKNFTTQEDSTPVILNPEDGAIVYTRKPTISGTAPAETSLSLYIDQVYNNKTIASEDGEFSMQTKKLTADEHVARVKNNDTGVRSDRVSFTVATIQTTDKILISGDYTDTLNTTNETKPKLVGNFYINGYDKSAFTVQVYIDDQLNGLVKTEDIKVTNNSVIASFTYEPFLKLDPGTHEAYIKVLRDSSAVKVNKVGGLASEIVTETSETRTFYVNGYSAPTLKFSNNKILVNARSGAIVRLYLDGTAYQEVVLDEDASGVAGAIINLSTITGSHTMTATARPIDISPESKLSESLSFTVATPASPTPTSPVIEEEEEEVVVVIPDPEIDTDEDGLTDEEEIIIGQDPNDDSDTKDLTEEEIIKKKEIIFEDKAAEEEIPKQYPTLGEEIIKMTDQEKKELKDNSREAIKETIINIQTDGQEQGAYIDPNTGQTTITFPQTLDIGDSFREAFGGQTQKQEPSNLTFSGVVPVVVGAKSYVILTLKSDPIVRIAEADANGQWTLSVPVDYLPEGEHTAYLQTDVNGVQTEQVQIARFVLQEQERFSNTTIFFIVNIAVAIFALLLAIFLQLRKNRKLIEQMNQEAA